MIIRTLLLALIFAAGCTPEAEIASYTVPKPPPPVRPKSLVAETGPTVVDREKLPVTFDLPEGWIEKPAGMMRLAEFEVREGDRQAIVSVATAGGDLVANINRWRGQVKLEDAADEEIRKSIHPMTVLSQPGSYVEVFGPETDEGRQAILGIIVPAGGQQWFIKLQGDAALAEREKARFEEFARSMRFR